MSSVMMTTTSYDIRETNPPIGGQSSSSATTVLTNGLTTAAANVKNNNIYRNESPKRIDYVLVYRTKLDDHQLSQSSSVSCMANARQIFESNLIDEGLVLERADSSGTGEYTYVHVFAPWPLLTRYAEVMKLRMPMKTIKSNMRELFDEEYGTDQMVFTAPYTRDKEYLFDIPVPDRDRFFTVSQRAQIVEFILKRKSFVCNATDVFSVGISKLINDNVYLAAYPLHEGKLNEDIDSKRSHLIDDWASLSSLLKSQPLERIVDYFGVKTAMYFAWIGFYTRMLVPASVIGLICFIYSVATLDRDQPTRQLCQDRTGRYMCPTCRHCNYTLLAQSCSFMRGSYLMDNPSTIVFAIFMSLWATVFLEMWKRYSAKISYKWDLSEFDAHEEYPRPEYLARLANRKAKRILNVITRMEEPYIPFLRGKLPHIIISSSLVLLCICLAIAIMISVIAYRVSARIVLNTWSQRSDFLQNYGSIITSSTAALINLLCILVLDRLYARLAYYLTERELPRTQFEFDNSLTLKMFLFQFVNYYSSIFYIAFVKGRFDGQEGRASNWFAEECPMGGCFLDLAIQLAIIMVGKQAVGAVLEILMPMATRFYNKWKYTQSITTKCGGSGGGGGTGGSSVLLSQWEEDFLLESWEPTSLFYEYLELVLQFGFVTIFVSAFPLAPLFALINNFFEIRLDAKKIVTDFKRPVAQRVKSIGIWYRILDAIAKLSVITNAMIIAFTTSFVPRLLYYIENGNYDNYLNSTLTMVTVSQADARLIGSSYCVKVNYYDSAAAATTDPTIIGSYGADGDHQYYWRLMVARLAFVVLFENVIVLLTSLMRCLIPDVPKNLRHQIRLHSYLTNELIMRHDLIVAKHIHCRD